MATSPAYALAHVFMFNTIKLKGTATVVGVIERREKFFFDAVWAQAHLEHTPFLFSQQRDVYRIGVVSLPPPTEMGEAYFVGLVAKVGDPTFGRYYTLEHDYVLATNTNRTLVCEREGSRHVKHGDGPPITGANEVDAAAFIDAVMERIVPTRVRS